MLPIYTVRNEIEKAVAENQVVIVVGETGSGKTTKLPQFLYHAGYAQQGVIGITEPRRIAATSVARFVAQELGSRLGELVGYQVRFDVQVEYDTAIKFMTDGILLREIQGDPNLSKYSVIMIDEAHERSQNIDFTLGLLKDLLKRRRDLKVIVASATIDAEKFSRYFDGAPVIKVSGRTYPVETNYRDHDVQIQDERGRLTMQYMVEEVVKQITAIHRAGQPGDILVFTTGKDDINMVIDKLGEKGFNDLIALPAYGGLSSEEQDRVFMSYSGQRKVVVATNIAETSITIDGVVYVVDCGYIKQNHFHPETGIQSLDLVKHSQAGCNQRSGRAGRTQPGICYRMYTESNFTSRRPYTEPEIRRVSIAGVVLAMEDIGITDIEGFDFLDAPEREAFHEAYQTLIALGAIASGKNGITDIGRQMARLPLEPRIARMLLEAGKYGCVIEVATVAAFLSVNHIFARPKGKERDADLAHARFKDERSDVLGFIKIWKEYVASGYNNSWCFKNFLNARSLGEIEKVREQLLNVLEQCGMTLSETEDVTVVLRSVTAGLIYNLFEYSSYHAYAGIFRENGMASFFVHPGSALFGEDGLRWIVAAEVVRTTRSFLRCCTKVEVAWLRELMPHRFSEEVHLDRFSEDGQSIIGRKTILFDRQGKKAEVDQEDVTLTLEEAKWIQDENIRQALDKGWRQLTFTREVSVSYSSYLETRDGLYRTWSSYDAEIGVSYYCEVEDFLSKRYARPKFQVFDIRVKEAPKAANPVKATTGTVLAKKGEQQDAPASHEALEALAAKWGGKVVRKK